MTGIGVCVGCAVGNHEQCDGPRSIIGCACADRDHKEKKDHA